MKSDKFIILDTTNTVYRNEKASWSCDVQIVYPPKRNSSLYINAIKNRFENTLKLEEKRKHLFTITINEDANYKTQRFK
jgi:hypothetical protein